MALQTTRTHEKVSADLKEHVHRSHLATRKILQLITRTGVENRLHSISSSCLMALSNICDARLGLCLEPLLRRIMRLLFPGSLWAVFPLGPPAMTCMMQLRMFPLFEAVQDLPRYQEY